MSELFHIRDTFMLQPCCSSPRLAIYHSELLLLSDSLANGHAVQNLRALREMTPNHGFYGPEKVHNDVTERKKTMQPFHFYYLTIFLLYYDLSALVFKHPGRNIYIYQDINSS